MSNAPYKAKWAKRIACPEDPWISARDHEYKGMMREGQGGRSGREETKGEMEVGVEEGCGTRRVS